jgi:hypothetical protein
MLEFFRHAEYGAIFLVVLGAFRYWTVTGIGAWQRVRSPQTLQQQEAAREAEGRHPH